MQNGLGFTGPPLRPLRPGFVRDWYGYVAAVTFTALNQRLPATIQLDGSADFELTQIACSTAEATQPAIMALLNIKDSATGYSLLSGQVPVEQIATTLTRVRTLDATHVFRSNASISLDVTNQGAATQTLYITLYGFKHWQIQNTPAAIA